jgi:radical SAM protein with 4Fe4S-binding SPASM domain
MDLIIKPTELCNFKCTFCSSTNITDDKSAVLDVDQIFQFLERFPDTRTIIVNGGDPLMMPPAYYWKIIDWLDLHEYETCISFTTNLWPFYKNPEKWVDLFNHERMGITTSFQYGGGRLKGDLTEFSESDFWKCSDAMLRYCGYRPDFITVITEENADRALDNVRLAKRMDVECKLNYAFSSGPPVKFRNIIMGQQGRPFVLADIYEIYLEIWREGLYPWEHSTKTMMKRLRGESTICPQNRDCDAGIRTLQPSGDYYSCGAFGDDKEYAIDFEQEMNSKTIIRILNDKPELQSLKQSCYSCPMFDICNGCRKTITDLKRHNLVERHCSKMKALAADIIESNGLTGKLEPTEYVREYEYIA